MHLAEGQGKTSVCCWHIAQGINNKNLLRSNFKFSSMLLHLQFVTKPRKF